MQPVNLALVLVDALQVHADHDAVLDRAVNFVSILSVILETFREMDVFLLPFFSGKLAELTQ